jgi:MFS family permease
MCTVLSATHINIDFADGPDGQFSGELKGIIAAAYSLGAILSLPFIGVANDRLGRRWSIFGGSVIMIVGSIIQGFSVNGKDQQNLGAFDEH